MRQPDSEIFNEYAKIAEEQGLVTEAGYADSRVVSDAPSVIEVLYNVKPNDEQSSIYADILDKAHPETAVISPAEDRLNGILENLKERQSVMAYIALKTPDGALIHRRYVKAHEDLLKSLVRVGFMMDNENQPDLMKLADSCANRLEKKAWLVALPWIAAGVASLLGSLALINRTDNSRQSVANNAEAVLRELSDLTNPALAPIVQDIHKNISALKEMAQRIAPIETQFISIENAVEFAQNNADKIDLMKQYVSMLQKVAGDIPKYIKNMQSIENMGSTSEYTPDWLAKLEDVGRLVFSITTDTEDVINALGGLQKAIDVALRQANQVMAAISGYRPQIEQKLQEDPSLVEKLIPNWLKEQSPSGSGAVSEMVSKSLGE